MSFLIGLLLFILLLIGLVSYGITRVVHTGLVKASYKRIKLITVITFIVIFLLITAGTIAALSTIEWGR